MSVLNTIVGDYEGLISMNKMKTFILKIEGDERVKKNINISNEKGEKKW
jgi:hypothetical protein